MDHQENKPSVARTSVLNCPAIYIYNPFIDDINGLDSAGGSFPRHV